MPAPAGAEVTDNFPGSAGLWDDPGAGNSRKKGNQSRVAETIRGAIPLVQPDPVAPDKIGHKQEAQQQPEEL